MSRAQAARLPNGRLHLNDGPIDLIIACDGRREDVGRAEDAAVARFSAILDELCTELPLLRRPADEMPKGNVARRMWRATSPFAGETFITPMAAVAGSVAEEVLDAMTAAASMTRAMVNNGGDIAFHLSRGTSYRVGLMDRPDCPSLFATADVASADPIRGVATSGWRGRSFSLGLADAVTVLAKSAGLADAAATLIANAVDLPGHPAVARAPATSRQPDSDLGERLVTVGVGDLSGREISLALDSGLRLASAFAKRGLIAACALHLAGETRSLDIAHNRPTDRIAHA